MLKSYLFSLIARKLFNQNTLPKVDPSELRENLREKKVWLLLFCAVVRIWKSLH